MEPYCNAIPGHWASISRRLPRVVRCANSVSQNLYSARRESQPRQAMNSGTMRRAGHIGAMTSSRDIQNLHITNMADSV